MAELHVRLVHDHQGRLGRLGRLVEGQDGLRLDRGTRGVVGRGDEDDVGGVLREGPLGGLHVDGEVLPAGAGDPAGAGAARDQGVHRVRGLEADRRAPRAAEGLEQLLEDLVGAVGGPDVLQGDRVLAGAGEVLRELRAQLHRVPVGVAVEGAGGLGDALGDAADQGLGELVRVLVGVQLDGHVQLGGAVGGLAAQLVADGEVVDADGAAHWFGTFHAKRAFRAAPCAGRSSASARVTTWWVTSARASRV